MELYWWFLLLNSKNFLVLIGCLGFFFCPIIYFYVSFDIDSFDFTDKEQINVLKMTRRVFILCFTMLFLGFLIPNEKQLAIMFAWDGIQCDQVNDVIELLKERLIK